MWILGLRGSNVSCENPQNPLSWRIADLLAQDLPDPCKWHALDDVVFDMCMHGLDRDKATTFRATPGFLSSLAVRCDRSHQHASCRPRQVRGSVHFPTSGEAEYPELLAKRYAQALYQQLLGQDLQFDMSHLQSGVDRPRDLRAFAKRRCPPLMPEYWLVCPQCCLPPHWPHKPLPPHVTFPKRGDEVICISDVQDVVSLAAKHSGQAKALVAVCSGKGCKRPRDDGRGVRDTNANRHCNSPSHASLGACATSARCSGSSSCESVAYWSRSLD